MGCDDFEMRAFEERCISVQFLEKGDENLLRIENVNDSIDVIKNREIRQKKSIL